MTKRLLMRCASAVALSMLAVPGSASAQRVDYALQAVTPSAAPRTTFPYLGVVPPGHLSGSPLVLAANVGAPQQQWLALCSNHPGDCDLTSEWWPHQFDPPGHPPVKLFQRFSGLCLTRPNTTGDGTRLVMSPCTRTPPRHYQQWWGRFSGNPNGPEWGFPMLAAMRGSMFIAESPRPQYTADDYKGGRRPPLRCLDITEFKNVPGTAIQLWRCTGGWNQKFRVITVRTH